MPNRILRDWTDSDRLDGVSAEAERMFVRLLMKADDYGRFHAEPRRLKAALFPLIDSLRQDAIVRWLTELSARQLILLYESADHRQLLAIPRFGQRLKQSVPKFPPPVGMPDGWIPDDSGNFPEVAARDGDVYGDGNVDGGGDEKACARVPAPPVAATPLPDWLPPEAWREWLQHRGAKATTPARKRQLEKLASLRAEGHDPAKLIALAIESGWATFWPPRGSDKGRASSQRAAVAGAMYGGAAEPGRREIDVTPTEVKRVA